MTVTGVILAIAGGSVGASLLLARNLARADICCSCRRRCELDDDVQVVEKTGRLICGACTRTLQPRRAT